MLALKKIRNVACSLTMVAALSVAAEAQLFTAPETKTTAPPGLEGVGIDQRLNEPVPMNLNFKDEQGRTVRLGDYFHDGRPVIVNLVYYQCPMLCTEVLNGLTSALKVMRFEPGKEFEVVTVSIDPRETPALAAKKKEMYLRKLGDPNAGLGWHFLTGQQAEITALADAVGWHYRYDAKLDQFAHAAGIVLATPQGRIAQYYYGVEYAPKDLRLGIIEASKNKIGSLADQVLLYCYHYDPRTGRYGATITNIVRLAGVATVIVLGGALVMLFRNEKQDHGIPPNRPNAGSLGTPGTGRA